MGTAEAPLSRAQPRNAESQAGIFLLAAGPGWREGRRAGGPLAWESPEAEGGRVGSGGVCLLLLGMVGEDLLMEFHTGLTACEPVLQECPHLSPSVLLMGPWATTPYAIYFWDFLVFRVRYIP